VAEGLANAEIAERLCVSQATVKARIDHLFTKAGRCDRAQAVNYAHRTEIATPPRSRPPTTATPRVQAPAWSRLTRSVSEEQQERTTSV
jgi:transposase